MGHTLVRAADDTDKQQGGAAAFWKKTAGTVFSFCRKNTVLCIAFAAALLSMIAVPPDAEYLSYFDLKTLSCLFCTLAVVCAFQHIRFFYLLARRVVQQFRNLRYCVIALVYITFLGSMLLANDMALLTFLPLGYFVLSSTGKQKIMAITFILQNIAANLGGMLTPFGNPQNLYLYSHFSIPNGEFVRIMLLPFLVSIFLVTICCFLVPKEALTLADDETKLDRKRAILYAALFALAIAIVFRTIPYWIGLIVIPAFLLIFDRKALCDVDYPLLLTFVCFFVFAGNAARIGFVREILSSLLEKDTLLTSALSCQVISNVPSAILLSHFTADYPALLVGVNIGGTGTLIASLASLITFREYTRHNPGKTRHYLALFSAFNFTFLITLLIISSVTM